MTSRSYFKKICKNLNSYQYTDEFKKGKNQIEKDLEVLVLLKDMFEKQWLKVIRDENGFCVIASDKFDDDDFYISNITYAKLKEWLKNEEDN